MAFLESARPRFIAFSLSLHDMHFLGDFFPHLSMVGTDVQIKIMKIARHVIFRVCKTTQREVVKGQIAAKSKSR